MANASDPAGQRRAATRRAPRPRRRDVEVCGPALGNHAAARIVAASAMPSRPPDPTRSPTSRRTKPSCSSRAAGSNGVGFLAAGRRTPDCGERVRFVASEVRPRGSQGASRGSGPRPPNRGSHPSKGLALREVRWKDCSIFSIATCVTTPYVVSFSERPDLGPSDPGLRPGRPPRVPCQAQAHLAGVSPEVGANGRIPGTVSAPGRVWMGAVRSQAVARVEPVSTQRGRSVDGSSSLRMRSRSRTGLPEPRQDASPGTPDGRSQSIPIRGGTLAASRPALESVAQEERRTQGSGRHAALVVLRDVRSRASGSRAVGSRPVVSPPVGCRPSGRRGGGGP